MCFLLATLVRRRVGCTRVLDRQGAQLMQTRGRFSSACHPKSGCIQLRSACRQAQAVQSHEVSLGLPPQSGCMPRRPLTHSSTTGAASSGLRGSSDGPCRPPRRSSFWNPSFRPSSPSSCSFFPAGAGREDITVAAVAISAATGAGRKREQEACVTVSQSVGQLLDRVPCAKRFC